MLEEVTADTGSLGLVEVTVSVGLLTITIDDVAGNETVSFQSSICKKICTSYTKVLDCFCKYGCCTKVDCIIKFNPSLSSKFKMVVDGFIFLPMQLTEDFLDIVNNILHVDQGILQDSQETANTSAM